MKNYKILWIDDDHEEFDDFKIAASNENIILKAFKSFNKGFEYLEKNIDQIDGVILDALFFENENQVKGTEDLKGFTSSQRRLAQIDSIKVLPRFILSGQTRFSNDSTFKETWGDHYKKSNQNDILRLFADIKKQVDESPDHQLKLKYHQVLVVCDDKYLGDKQFDRIFSLVKHIENLEYLKNTEDQLNPIRKIIEALFIRFGELGIIPMAILNNKGWINGSSLFLSNKHSDYHNQSELIPPTIGENIHRLLNIIQDASHSEGELKLKVDDYLKSASSDYLYRSCVYLVFDILLWAKTFIDENLNIPENKMLLNPKVYINESIKGKVININKLKGFAFFRPDSGGDSILIPPHLVTNHSLYDDMPIIVEIEEYTDNRTNELKTRVKSIHKL